MKSKNVARLFIFVFFLSLIVFSQPQESYQVRDFTFDWRIPQTIIARYEAQGMNLNEAKANLELDFEIFDLVIQKRFKGKAWGKIGHAFARKRANFTIDGDLTSAAGEIAKFFEEQHGKNYNMLTPVIIQCVDLGENAVIDDQPVDIIATINFNIEFNALPEDGLQKQDPPGVITMFHRKICTWF